MAPLTVAERDWTIPLIVDGPRFLAAQPVTAGLPFPNGVLPSATSIVLTDADGHSRPVQTKSLATWDNGSVRWLLLDFVAKAGPTVFHLRSAAATAIAAASRVVVQTDEREYVINTGLTVFRVGRVNQHPLLQVDQGLSRALDPATKAIVLTDAKGRAQQPRFEQAVLESEGPVRATIRLDGHFVGRAACRFIARLCFFAGTGLVRLRFTIHNPRRAKHRGNLWDLGDRGSIYFRDLSVELGLSNSNAAQVHYSADLDQPLREAPFGRFELYQDSSGGDNWHSRNHINRHGVVPHSFRGFRLCTSGEEWKGFRANPTVRIANQEASIAAAVPEFWQQFPKAIEIENSRLCIRLFPKQFADLFELQGGEQKTHTIWLHFGRSNTPVDVLDWVYRPAIVRAPAEWYSRSGSFPNLLPAGSSRDRFDEYLSPLIAGPNSLITRREVIDEYGWRHFGDLYADHENEHYHGPQPLISHYNNQFDSVHGAMLQFVRTGDIRWRDIADPLARHVIDIDIYHTAEDRSAYRGGLFWMTDHYKDAGTATHRTYTRLNNAPGRSNGGGPGCEHNFTTGLLEYYYFTGDPLAHTAVIGLADWVVRMDDGRLTLLKWLDSGPTGRASYTGNTSYHGPGRGPGLSINALLDGWLLTRDRNYCSKAEELVRRCCHPNDDVDSLDLLNAELRWSYTIYLAALLRFLRTKEEFNSIDYMYAYIRATVLHYARWMAEREHPYFDQRDRLEFPNETWAAQEFRKANVMRAAASYADEPLRSRLLTKGAELANRAWTDLMRFESRHSARASAILMTEGTVDQFFRSQAPEATSRSLPECDFGQPEQRFETQRQRAWRLRRIPHRLVQSVWRGFRGV